jgi:hypothetical protein
MRDSSRNGRITVKGGFCRLRGCRWIQNGCCAPKLGGIYSSEVCNVVPEKLLRRLLNGKESCDRNAVELGLRMNRLRALYSTNYLDAR